MPDYSAPEKRQPVLYRVQPGDTTASIAAANNTSSSAIVNLNGAKEWRYVGDHPEFLKLVPGEWLVVGRASA